MSEGVRAMGHGYLVLGLIVLSGALGCPGRPGSLPISVEPQGRGCEVILSGPEAIGDMRLWVPEGIVSETGICAVYPVGQPWRRDGRGWVHQVEGEGIIGPGNFVPVGEGEIECVGIRMPIDQPVAWRTRVAAGDEGVRFVLDVTNRGNATITKAGAAICLRFLEAEWWADEHVFVRSGGRIRSLASLGRDAGQPNAFQAWLMRGETFDHVFYRAFWGFNRNRLDAPIMISEHRTAGLCVGISSETAYFLHSNPGNPCTDIMLAFGDIEAGQTRRAEGLVWVREGLGADLLGE